MIWHGPDESSPTTVWFGRDGRDGSMDSAAILIAPLGVSGALRGLMDRLAAVSVVVTIVDDVSTATDIARSHALPPALLLDLRELSPGEVEDIKKACELIRRVLVALPSSLPVIVTSDADARMIVACI